MPDRHWKPAAFDADEPRRVGESVKQMDLRYATVTGVARDDLPDEGAWLYAETIRQIHRQSPGTGVEILVPDFSGKPELLQKVFDASPEVFAHNVETVRESSSAFGLPLAMSGPWMF